MHSPTLLILATLLMAIMTIMLTAAWRFNQRIAGFGTWALSYFCGFLFCTSLLMRPLLPEWWAVLAAQLSTFSMAYLNLSGTRAYIGAKPIPWPTPSLGLLGLVGILFYFTEINPQPGIRFALSSLGMGIIFLLCAQTIARGKRQDYPARYLYALTSASHGLFLLIRPWLFQADQALFDAEKMLTVSQFIIIESIVAIVLMAFCVIMLANEQVMTELRRMADKDPLTSVFNRRSFLTLLDKCASHAARMRSPLSLMLIDLDHFKKINDTWGHKTGDEALRHFVQIAESCLRHEDIIGRLGGEEFAIFLPNADASAAKAIADRLRAMLEQHPAQHEEGAINLTISIGVTEYRQEEAPEAALHRADAAMYQAKKNGRNRVELATDQS